MYASVSRTMAKPGHLDEFASSYKAQCLPALSLLHGFRSVIIVSAEPSNTVFVVSLWNSEADRDLAQASHRDVESDALAPFLAQGLNQAPFEVLVQAGDPGGALFARLITLPVPAQNIDAALGVYKAEYLPLLQAQPGFLQVMWLANRNSGTGWGMSFWSTHEQMQAADHEGEFFPRVLARLAVYFSGKPEMAYYTVNEQFQA